MKHMSIPGLAVLALCTGLLAGCGGGHDSVAVEPPATTGVPGAVASSVDALVKFAKNLVSDDAAEPLSLGEVVPATDDTGEPAGL